MFSFTVVRLGTARLVGGMLLGTSLLTGCLAAWFSPEQFPVEDPVPAGVQEIEIVDVEGQAPSVTLKATPSSSPPRRIRPSTPTLNLLPLLGGGEAFRGCRTSLEKVGTGLQLKLTASSNLPCGYGFSLQQGHEPLDLLSYNTFHLVGDMDGPVTLQLADRAAHQWETPASLTTVNGHFDIRIPLEPAARRLDLRELVSLVILTKMERVTVEIKVLEVEQALHSQRSSPRLGVWIWDYQRALSDREDVVKTCQRYGITRIMLQMPAVADTVGTWAAYASFLRTMGETGIEVFALDGSPESINAPEVLVGKVKMLRTLLPGDGLAGVQLDIEPYLLKGFFLEKTGFNRYLSTLDQVKQAIGDQARFSIAIPFWFTSISASGRPVAFSVMDLADEVAVMSYRTDVKELQTISEDSLRYGKLAGVPVWLSVETQPLPLERRVMLKRVHRWDLADAFLDPSKRRVVLAPPPPHKEVQWFHIHHRVIVRPERLSFFDQSRQHVLNAVHSVMRAVGHSSFAGMMIHDFNGFTALHAGE